MIDYVVDRASMNLTSTLARFVNLVNLRLTGLRVETRRPDDVHRIEVGFDIEMENLETTCHVVEDRLLAKVGVRVVGREFRAGEPVEGDPVLRVWVEHVIEYELHLPKDAPKTLPEDVLTAFASVNGVYNAWPYIRQCVHRVTTEMGIPAVVPSLHVRPAPPEAPSDHDSHVPAPNDADAESVPKKPVRRSGQGHSRREATRAPVKKRSGK